VAFTLRFTVHGVIMYIEKPDQSAATLLLCKLGKDLVKRGTSYIKFDDRNYVQDTRNRRAVDGTNGTQHHIELNGEELSIDADVVASDRTLRIDKSKDPVSSTPTESDKYSLHWMTTLEDLERGFGKVQPGYFASPPTGSPELVARIEFTQGKLGTTGAERVLVPFKKGSAKPTRRALARELVIDMDVGDDHFFLRSTPLYGGSSRGDMRFDANGMSVLEIHLGNEAFDDIYWETPSILPIDVVQQNGAKEYEFYYSLCDVEPLRPRTLPLVASRVPGNTFCSVNGGGG
jgi:hypothetical protein